jgi:hypothetical protein
MVNVLVATRKSRGSKQGGRMMVQKYTNTYFVPFVGGITCSGFKGPICGTRNHDDSTKHRADMCRLS